MVKDGNAKKLIPSVAFGNTIFFIGNNQKLCSIGIFFNEVECSKKKRNLANFD